MAVPDEAGASDPAVRVIRLFGARLSEILSRVTGHRARPWRSSVSECARQLAGGVRFGRCICRRLRYDSAKGRTGASSDTNHDSYMRCANRGAVWQLKNTRLFGTVAACSVFAALVILFWRGGRRFLRLRHCLFLRRRSFSWFPPRVAGIYGKVQKSLRHALRQRVRPQRRDARAVDFDLYHRRGYRMFVFERRRQKAGSFIVLGCGICVAALCFAGRKSLLKVPFL